MKIKNILFCFILSVVSFSVSAQSVKGVVKGGENAEALIGASVYWAGTSVGVSTSLDGSYTIHRVKGYDQLVAS